METKRIVVRTAGNGKFEAMLEDMATQKIVRRGEKRETVREAIGTLVALHCENFALYEVIMFSPCIPIE